jgi:hypothetical protein
LVEYLDLNEAGFRKVLKKHDKLTAGRALKPEYMPLVEQRFGAQHKPVLQVRLWHAWPCIYWFAPLLEQHCGAQHKPVLQARI